MEAAKIRLAEAERVDLSNPPEQVVEEARRQGIDLSDPRVRHFMKELEDEHKASGECNASEDAFCVFLPLCCASFCWSCCLLLFFID